MKGNFCARKTLPNSTDEQYKRIQSKKMKFSVQFSKILVREIFTELEFFPLRCNCYCFKRFRILKTFTRKSMK